jgi:hypothetical protein
MERSHNKSLELTGERPIESRHQGDNRDKVEANGPAAQLYVMLSKSIAVAA